MMDLRAMIIERMRASALKEGSLLDVYNQLVLCGASHDAAIAALSAFVDEIIERKVYRDDGKGRQPQ